MRLSVGTPLTCARRPSSLRHATAGRAHAHHRSQRRQRAQGRQQEALVCHGALSVQILGQTRAAVASAPAARRRYACSGGGAQTCTSNAKRAGIGTFKFKFALSKEWHSALEACQQSSEPEGPWGDGRRFDLRIVLFTDGDN